MTRAAPEELEVYASFSIHLGLRYEAAGLRVEFHYNQAPGTHFRVEPPEEYRAAILKGIEEGMASRFPDFPSTGSVWVTEVTAHEVDSSQRAFYRAGRLVINQAHSLCETAKA
jgi:hypothetical protein